jgi:hypothetical protein
MANEVTVKNDNSPVLSVVELALVTGDLAKLKPEERVNYYNAICESVGVNPLTRPFDYITLNGKLTLYAKRECTEQLRKLHKVSIKIADSKVIDGVLVVTADAKDSSGREDSSTGAVNIKGLQGEALANAYMKAETKAKRRVTLSICGLGVLDESEIESIPESRDLKPQFEVPNNVVAITDAKSPETAQPPADPEPQPEAKKVEPVVIEPESAATTENPNPVDDAGFQADAEKPFIKNKVAEPKVGEMVFACWEAHKGKKLKEIPTEALSKMADDLDVKAKAGAKFPAEWQAFYETLSKFLNRPIQVKEQK